MLSEEKRRRLVDFSAGSVGDETIHFFLNFSQGRIDWTKPIRSDMTLVFWVFSLLGFSASQDTVALAEVAVYAPALDRFAQGQKVVSFEKKELQAYAARS
ncbi:MAG: hypothetical protein B7Z16_19115, partial [Algoriphagus sp. 32-45-6]